MQKKNMRMQINWHPFVTTLLGLWLMASGFFFDEASSYLSFVTFISGLTIFVLGACRQFLAVAGVGVWLLFMPLIFWAKNPASYLNDTVMGALAILIGGVLPSFKKDEAVLQSSPSSWKNRIPVAMLAFFAFLTARYMASFQLGYISTIWDPVFGDGTQQVITSKISQSFPISDAGLGSALYLLEALLALAGPQDRYKTSPWLVFSFGLLVIPVGVVSSILILLQPLAVGHWCFWCLLTAAFMSGMVYFALPEVKAAWYKRPLR